MRSLTISGRLIVIWFLTFGVVTAVPFVITGLSVSFATALDVLTGTASPFASHAGVAGVFLAIAGYLMVPAAIGTLAAVLFDRQLRARALEPDEINRRIRRVVAERLPTADPSGDHP